MTIPYIERAPSKTELEKLRLILSTFQDGTGMLSIGKGRTLPGWRDFERAFAASTNGDATEDKSIYDVLLPHQEKDSTYYGVSCKMRKTLRYVETKGVVTIEVSNASGEFWDNLEKQGLTKENYDQNPDVAGNILIGTIESWHERVDIENNGGIYNDASIFLSLQWDQKEGLYQLFRYPIRLPNATSLEWEVIGRRLVGKKQNRVIFEWYGLSGGQLKYYPLAKDATWQSQKFSLESLPTAMDLSLDAKAQRYFPSKWKEL